MARTGTHIWRRLAALALALGAVLVVSRAPLAALGDEDPPAQERVEADANTARAALERFNRSFDTVDIDFKQEAVRKLATVVHDSVARRIVKLLKSEDPHIRQVAAEGLGHQFGYAKPAAKKLLVLAMDNQEEPKVVAAAVTSIGALEYRQAEPDIRRLIDHEEDRVVVAAFGVYGAWKCDEALQSMLNFFTKYPDEKQFKTGSVTVDTGAAGNEDQKAAQAKWKRKYGSQRSWRPRPDCTQALREALKQITGFGFRRPEDLARFMNDREKYRDPEKIAERKDEKTRREIYAAWLAAIETARARSEKAVPGEEASDERAKVYHAEIHALRGEIMEKHGLFLSELDVVVEEGDASDWK